MRGKRDACWRWPRSTTEPAGARIGGVGLQIIRDRVVRFNAEGPDGLLDPKAPGKAPLLTQAQRTALARAVEAGPKPYLDGVVRWRLVDLAQWVWEEFAVPVSRQTLGRELRALGFRKLSARPRRDAQDPDALEAFKNLPERLAEMRARLPTGTELELWRQDEARIGQKNPITRPLSANACIRLPGSGWARRGTRLRAPHDQLTRWACIFGAIRPAKGKAAGLVMPFVDAEAMQAHLAEIGLAVDPGAHAAPMLDQAGRRMSARLVVPDDITLLPLPPRSPELNLPLGVCKRTPAGQPVENDRRFMRDNRLSNRVFEGCSDIVAFCCEALNKLADQPRGAS